MSTSFPVPRDAVDSDHPLAWAFASFTEAAGSLERTYGQLQAQVAHLRQELEVTNRDLANSLEENRRIRERLRRLEGLPCGVLVMEAGARISILNPEAARLLGNAGENGESLSPAHSAALEMARETGEERELSLPEGDEGDRSEGKTAWVAVRRAWLDPDYSTSVFILRDVSEAKKLERERENVRRQQALVEMSALLVHEIRNPLGSLELFAGLLAEADLGEESGRWVEHVQAGLRTLLATVNNVLHLHNVPPPECAEMDMGQLLDWAYEFLLPLAKQARVEFEVVNELRGVRAFLALAAVAGLFAWRIPQGKETLEVGAPAAPEKDKKAAKTESLEDLLKLDELSLEVGYALVSLVDAQQGGQLLGRVKAMRNNLALQLGFIVPPIHITDNVSLQPREYLVSMRGVEIARWKLHEDDVLAISSELNPPALAGPPTREPAFGVAATWIARNLESQALAAGYAVVDQTSVLATHLAELIRQHAYELLSRQETKRLLDRLSESHPKLVEELVPKVLSLGEIQKVLQQLLREQVSIRDLSTILETLLDTTAVSKNPVLLVEAVRQSWGAPSPPRRCPPPARACSPRSCGGSSRACANLPESKWHRPLQCCCARRPPAFTCGVCSSRFSPKLLCFLRWRFLPVSVQSLGTVR